MYLSTWTDPVVTHARRCKPPHVSQSRASIHSRLLSMRLDFPASEYPIARSCPMPKTVVQLRQQIAELQQREQALLATEIEGVVGRIREAISFYQLSPEQLFGPLMAKRTSGRCGAKVTKGASSKAASKRLASDGAIPRKQEHPALVRRSRSGTRTKVAMPGRVAEVGLGGCEAPWRRARRSRTSPSSL